MTVSGRDIYTAAALLIREHGSRAKSVAENRAAELKVAGDEAGYAAFTRIAAAIKELGQLEPAVGSRRDYARELVRGAPAFSLTTFAAQPTWRSMGATAAPVVIAMVGMEASLLSAPTAPMASPFVEENHQQVPRA